MSDPFDDPEIRAAMAAAGVVHTPGLAKEMLDRMAPLLAAEGIDLDNLDGTNLDAVNEAFARATERYNLELSTPIGAHLDDARRVLSSFTELIAAGRAEDAFEIVDAIPSDPGKRQASVAHVMGEALGRLDEWHADPAYRDSLMTAYVPKIVGVPRAVARAMLLAAREHQALANLGMFIRHAPGPDSLEGAMLAVAGSIQAIAAGEGQGVPEVARRMLLGDGGRKAPKASVFGEGVARGARMHPASILGPALMESRRALREYRNGLEARLGLTPQQADDRTAVLRRLFRYASDDGIDLCDPADVEFAVELIVGWSDPEDPEALQVIDDMLDSLDEYIHFRLARGEREPDWADAHQIVEYAMEETMGPTPFDDLLDRILDEEEVLDDDEVRSALAATLIVGGVTELLEWIGTSKPVTSTGGLRRVDIEFGASLIGLHAVGVASLPPVNWEERSYDVDNWPRPGSSPAHLLHVQSMWEARLLGSWWAALKLLELIEVRGTRVRPGPAAATWRADALPPIDLASSLVSTFVGYLFVGVSSTNEILGSFRTGAAVVSLLSVLDGGAGPDIADSDLDTEFMHVAGGAVMKDLQGTGLLTSKKVDGVLTFSAVPELHPALMRGLMLAITLSGELDDQDDFDGE